MGFPCRIHTRCRRDLRLRCGLFVWLSLGSAKRFCPLAISSCQQLRTNDFSLALNNENVYSLAPGCPGVRNPNGKASLGRREHSSKPWGYQRAVNNGGFPHLQWPHVDDPGDCQLNFCGSAEATSTRLLRTLLILATHSNLAVAALEFNLPRNKHHCTASIRENRSKLQI